MTTVTCARCGKSAEAMTDPPMGGQLGLTLQEASLRSLLCGLDRATEPAHQPLRPQYGRPDDRKKLIAAIERVFSVWRRHDRNAGGTPMTHAAPHQDVVARLPDRFRGVLLGSRSETLSARRSNFSPLARPNTISRRWSAAAGRNWRPVNGQTIRSRRSVSSRACWQSVSSIPDDIARRFVVWMQSNPKDIGLHTRRVLDAIQRGDSWEEASRDRRRSIPTTLPMRSLMRCARSPSSSAAIPDYVASLSPVLSRIHPRPPRLRMVLRLPQVAIVGLLNGQSRSEAIELAYDANRRSLAGAERSYRSGDDADLEVAPTGYVLDTLEVRRLGLSPYQNLRGRSHYHASIVRGRGYRRAVVGALAGRATGMSNIPSRWLIALKRNFSRLCRPPSTNSPWPDPSKFRRSRTASSWLP